MASKDKPFSSGDYRQRSISFTRMDAERNGMIDVSEPLATLCATAYHSSLQEIAEKLEQAQSDVRQLLLDLESERDQRRILQSRVEDLGALTVSRSGRFNVRLVDREPS